MSAPKVTQTENAKLYGDCWVYRALACHTGALHAQPGNSSVRIDCCCDFTPDYKAFFDHRGALDAPEFIPSGSVRAHDFDGSPGRILVGHVYREGTRS